MNSKKLYDKVSGSLKKGIMATGLTALVLGSSGCATLSEFDRRKFDTNTIDNLEANPLTQDDARYKIEGFDSDGINYTALKHGYFKVDNNVYHTPAIVITNESGDLRDYENKKVEVFAEKYFPLVPVQALTGYLHVAPSGDNTSEKSVFKDIRVKKINPQHKGFGFTKREDEDEEFSIPGFNLDEKLKRHFIEDRSYLFIRNREPIFPIGSKIHNKTTELESLPLAFYGKPISTSSNRANGNFSIHGKMYKPVLGVRVDAPQNPPTKEFEIKGTTHNSTNH